MPLGPPSAVDVAQRFVVWVFGVEGNIVMTGFGIMMTIAG